VETISGPFLRTEKGTGLSAETIKALISQESKMAEQDSVIEACVNARNQLEAYVFDFRAELEHSLKPFVLSEESDSVQDGEDWAAARALYEAKFAEAKAVGDVIIERKRSSIAREDVAIRFESMVNRIRAGANDLLAKIASNPSPAVVAEPVTPTVKDPLSIKCEMCPKTARDVGKRLMRCTNCYGANYCSKDCQKNHWPGHKKTCVKRPAPVDDSVAIHMPSPTAATVSTTTTTTTLATPTATTKPPVDESEPVRKLLDSLSSAERWLSDLQAQQGKLGLAAPAAFQVHEVETKIQAIESQWNPLRKDLSAPAKKQKQEAKPEDDGKTEGKEALQIEMAPSADVPTPIDTTTT